MLKNKMNLDIEITPVTKINSNWITGRNIKCNIIKLLRNYIKENLYYLRFDDDFLDAAPKTPSRKDRIDKLHFFKN